MAWSRILLGGAGAALLLGGGYMVLASSEQDTPPILPPPPELADDEQLPLADPGDMQGQEPPEATELSRQQRRFARFDRNRDNVIMREEMLASRTKAFRKLDADGNNLLTF